jgi:hypothetical protein
MMPAVLLDTKDRRSAERSKATYAKRREVRRSLAQRSNELLAGYRRGEPVGEACPLVLALSPGRPASG